MGAVVSMIGLVGNDDFGQSLRQLAARDGIDTKHVGIEPKEATGIALDIGGLSRTQYDCGCLGSELR